jgi:RNA recognition motif-containing protein
LVTRLPNDSPLRGSWSKPILENVSSGLFSSQKKKEIMEKKLYVGNLAYSTTDSSLETLFGRVGSVVKATVIMDRETGRSKGFGFVEMADEAGAAAAIAQLNGTQLDGRALKVAEAQARQDRDSRPARRW